MHLFIYLLLFIIVFIRNFAGIIDNRRMVNTVEVYDPTTGVVSQLAAMKNPRSNMGIAVLHDHIYVVGGNGIRGPLSSVERYSIDEVST